VVLLLLWVIGLATGSAAQVEALQLVLRGPFAFSFWFGAVALGALVPLMLLAVAARLPRVLAPAALLLLLAGGLVLRFVVVDAGQMSRLMQSVGPVIGAGS
jgi:protein NrfD